MKLNTTREERDNWAWFVESGEFVTKTTKAAARFAADCKTLEDELARVRQQRDRSEERIGEVKTFTEQISSITSEITKERDKLRDELESARRVLDTVNVFLLDDTGDNYARMSNEHERHDASFGGRDEK